jgi:hypothetical protein
MVDKKKPEGPLWVRNRASLRFGNVRFNEDCCLQAYVSGAPEAVIVL